MASCRTLAAKIAVPDPCRGSPAGKRGLAPPGRVRPNIRRCETQAQTLSYLRALGLVRRPIVCVAHHPLIAAAWLRCALRSCAGSWPAPTLSPACRPSWRHKSNAIVPGRSEAVPWGPDADFSLQLPGRGTESCQWGARGAILPHSEGRHNGGGAGKNHLPPPLRFFGVRAFGVNVEVYVQPNSGWMPYSQLVGHYARARALAIPHYGQASIVGLSSLIDALGMGKPVVMTRHPLVDLDIEKEGAGRWVAAGDAEGWRAAIEWFDRNPDQP